VICLRMLFRGPFWALQDHQYRRTEAGSTAGLKSAFYGLKSRLFALCWKRH
jgi:hypothetical protein